MNALEQRIALIARVKPSHTGITLNGFPRSELESRPRKEVKAMSCCCGTTEKQKQKPQQKEEEKQPSSCGVGQSCG